MKYAPLLRVCLIKCKSTALGIALTSLLTGCFTTRSTPPSAIAGSWLAYQSGPSHNAVFPAGASRSWEFEAGGQINGGLALASGRLFVDTIDAQVLALNANDGTIIWSATTDNVTMSTPVVAHNIVYIGTGRNGASTGSRHFAYMSTSSGSSLQPWGRAEGDHILAFRANDGKALWKYRTIGEDMPTPTLADDTLVFGNGDFHAYGLDPDRGTARWRVDVGGIVTMASATILGKNDVLISTCGEDDRKDSTLLLRARTGKIVWRSPFGNCDSTPTVGANRIFVSGVDATRTEFGYGGRAIIAALSPRTGKPKWFHVEAAARPYTSVGSSERAITGTYADGVYFQPLPSYDEIVAFIAGTGRVRWVAHTVAPVKMSPIILGRCVFAGDSSGLYYVFDTITGSLIQTRMFDAPFATSPPIIQGHTTYLVNGSKIYAFPTQSLFFANRGFKCKV